MSEARDAGGGLWRCLICGAHVSDRAAHLAWHEDDVLNGPGDPA